MHRFYIPPNLPRALVKGAVSIFVLFCFVLVCFVLFVCLFVCLCVCVSVWVFVCLFVCLFCLFVFVFVLFFYFFIIFFLFHWFGTLAINACRLLCFSKCLSCIYAKFQNGYWMFNFPEAFPFITKTKIAHDANQPREQAGFRECFFNQRSPTRTKPTHRKGKRTLVKALCTILNITIPMGRTFWFIYSMGKNMCKGKIYA